MKEAWYEYITPDYSDVVKCTYLAEETSDPLTGVVVDGVDPDDANDTDNVPQFRSNLARLELGKLFTGLLQYGQVGQV